MNRKTTTNRSQKFLYVKIIGSKGNSGYKGPQKVISSDLKDFIQFGWLRTSCSN